MQKLVIGDFAPLTYACDEAVNTLCTNLSFSGDKTKKIIFTSCHASEGKTFTTMNVMRTLANLGYAVVLVDADLRRSVIKERYGLTGVDKGLSHYLAGRAEIEDVLYETNIPGAYMIPVGKTVSNALPLLNSARCKELLDYLAGEADYVLVDAAPVGTVIDAAQIAKYCDGTALVIKYNSVTRKELVDVKEQLEQTGCPILGTVLVMVEYDNYLNKNYYYKSYYSHYDSYYKNEGEKSGKEHHHHHSTEKKQTK